MLSRRRGISPIIAYVLLVSFVLVMVPIVYQGLKSYVPQESLECPEGISVFVQDYSCEENEDGTYNLTLEIKNNGRFDVGGFLIHAGDGSSEVASEDLSSRIIEGGKILGGMVVFASGDDNPLGPGNMRKTVFNINQEIAKVDILPMRFQEKDGKKKIVICSNAGLKEDVACR